MTEFYQTGAVTVTNGDATIVAESPALWIPANVKKGDTFQTDQIPPTVIVSDPIFDDYIGTYTFDIAFPYAGPDDSGLAYTIIKTSSEWGTNRTLAAETAALIQAFAAGTITEDQLNAAVAAAEAAEAGAEAAFDQIDSIYLGAKNADPTADNGGGALVAGQIYYNTVNALLRLYSGSAWSNMLAGQAGIQGVGAGLQYQFMTSTTDSDPGGPGFARLNNTDHTLATKTWMDNTDVNNVAMQASIDTWDDSTSTLKGYLYIWNRTNRAIFRLYSITGTIVDKTGYREVPLSYITSVGVLANATQCEFVFIPKGDKGDTGAAAAAVGTAFTFSTTTTDADPGNGIVRFSSATFGSIADIYFDNQDNLGGAQTDWLDALDDVTNANNRGILRGEKATDKSVFAEFAVIGDVVDGGGYRKVPVDPIAGAVPADATSLVWSFAPSGADGIGVDGIGAGILFNFDDSIADSNPTAGGLRANDGDFEAATKLFVSKTARGGQDLATTLATWSASSNPSKKGDLTIVRPSDGATWTATLTSIEDASGYVKLTIANNSVDPSLANGDVIGLQFARTGDKGASGDGSGDVNKPVDPVTAHHLVAFANTDGDHLESAGVALAALLQGANNFSDVGNKKTALDTLFQSGATVSAGATVDLDAFDGPLGTISGNTGISAITLADGKFRLTRFSGTPLITVGADLVLNTNATNYQVVAGDVVVWFGRAGATVQGLVFPISGASPSAMPISYLDTDIALTANSDAKVPSQKAAKAYVDTSITAQNGKPSVLCATTAALPTNTLSSSVLTASANGALTIDGQTPALNDRILAKNEASTQKNGIYYLSQLGDASHPWKLTRALDMDAWTEVPNANVWVQNGTTNADTAWVCTSSTGGTLNTTGITWKQFGWTNISTFFATLFTEASASSLMSTLGAMPKSPGSSDAFQNRPVITKAAVDTSPGASGEFWIDGYAMSIVDVDTALANVNTAQYLLLPGRQIVRLWEDTVYDFEGHFWLTRAAGTTSHTTSLLFDTSVGGTGTIQSIEYLAQVSNPTGNALANVQQIVGNAATAVAITAANIVATENLLIYIRGTMLVDPSHDTYVAPQFKYSAAPGGAPTIKKGSFFKIWPAMPSLNTEAGDWQ